MNKLTENFGIKIEERNENSNAKEIIKWFADNGFDTNIMSGNGNEPSIYFVTENKYVRCGRPDNIKTYTLKEVLNMKFVLPEKWCVKPKTPNEANIIFQFKGISENNDSKAICYYQHYPPVQTYCTAYSSIQEGYTEITFEQFQKYVLNKSNMKEIIGYKLKKDCEQYKNPALEIAGKNNGSDWNLTYGYHFTHDSRNAEKLKNAGVLDLWFEPVYAQDEFKLGDWVYIKSSGSHINGIYGIDTNNPVRILKYKENITMADHPCVGAYSSYCLFEDGVGKKVLFNATKDIDYIVKKATEDEIKEHLIKEAKSRGFIEGVKYHPVDKYIKKVFKDTTLCCRDSINYYPESDTLCYNGNIYSNGVWAEIVKDKVVYVQCTSGSFPVTVSKSGFEFEGYRINVSDIESLLKETVVGNWSAIANTFTIGCKKNITRESLQELLVAYREL